MQNEKGETNQQEKGIRVIPHDQQELEAQYQVLQQ